LSHLAPRLFHGQALFGFLNNSSRNKLFNLNNESYPHYGVARKRAISERSPTRQYSPRPLLDSKFNLHQSTGGVFPPSAPGDVFRTFRFLEIPRSVLIFLLDFSLWYETWYNMGFIF
jgi:hypothetical protein